MLIIVLKKTFSSNLPQMGTKLTSPQFVCFFCWIVCITFVDWPTKNVRSYFQYRPVSEILTIANFQTQRAGRLRWMKLCSSDDLFNMVPKNSLRIIRKCAFIEDIFKSTIHLFITYLFITYLLIAYLFITYL